VLLYVNVPNELGTLLDQLIDSLLDGGPPGFFCEEPLTFVAPGVPSG